MKPFNLEEYIANPNKKLITRDGRKVTKLLCTNAKGSLPIVALVETYNNSEYPYPLTKEGKDSPGVNHANDLFFVTEKHEGWVNIFKCINGENYVGDARIFKLKEDAEKIGKNRNDYITTIKIEWEE